MKPRLWVFAGPNGAGKSTIVDRYVGDRIPIVNPDNIARELPATVSGTARILQAGKLALTERTRLLTAGRTFGIETTLTGHSELDLMRAAIDADYSVNLVYVGLRNAQHSIARVNERTRRGGHDVPVADLFRRFDRSLANLRKAMSTANHRVILLDNSGSRRRLVFTRIGARARYRSPNPPEWAASIIR
ncbi:AAA family ATPase [Sphingobium xenophagum]|uniref:AAA family ATPase n=1 Tax=Sphingobium xenophagum TaxID=121428 RepID=UPI00055B0119|nr:AAA family ATPase [Sphingobium xenophagum]